MKTNREIQDTDMENSALHELFIEELKGLYWAEKYLTKNLPKMAEKATSSELKSAIESHLQETKEHVNRLEKVFKSINTKVTDQKCDSMTGLVDEANQLIGETEEGSMTRDVAIISCAQKVEHYEIATYGTLKTLARVMGHKEAEELLDETLSEEKKANTTLTEIAESFINEEAKNEKK